jgi:hypothetical protein
MMKNFTAILLMLFTVFNCYAASNHHPTIILVHGALLTSSSWAPVQSYLQNHGYNVVTIDTPGRANDKVKPDAATLTAATNKLCALSLIPVIHRLSQSRIYLGRDLRPLTILYPGNRSVELPCLQFVALRHFQILEKNSRHSGPQN